MPTNTKKSPAKSSAAKSRKAPPTPDRARRRAASIPAEGPISLQEARALVLPPKPAKPKPRAAPTAKAARRTPVARAALPEATPEALGAQRKRTQLAQRDEVKQRVKDYKSMMQLMKRRGVKGLAPSAEAAPPGRRRAPSAGGAPLQVLAEGDSWFDYPVPFFGGGVIPRLESRLGVPILNLAKAGDEVRYMMGVAERKLMAQQLRSGCPAGGNWDVLLFSGGGNDIVDNPMALWIRDHDPAGTPAQQINRPRFDAALSMVRAGYEDLIAMRDSLSPGTHLVFHAYDYAIPDGRGICHLGPWLKPTFDLRGFPSQSAAFEVVKVMLTEFASMLRALAAAQPGVTVIDAQGTLAPVRESWHNELHPSRKGFEAFATRFHTELRTLFPGRVL